MIVKICGLTNPEDAALAAAAGADWLGFVFAEESRRQLCLDDCRWIRTLATGVKVGVFRDQPVAFVEQVRDAAKLDLVQLHGSESADACIALGGQERVIKAIGVRDAVDWKLVESYVSVARVLFDTAGTRGGGSGREFDRSLLVGRPLAQDCLLAGGLTPENAAAAIALVGPAGVDVASGVEIAPGRKDAEKMRRFVSAAREAGDRGQG